jgi:hypothetical protein
MKPTPQQHSFRFNHLGIGDIQLGKRPEQLSGMLPFDHFLGTHHVFDGDLRCTIESRDTGIELRHLIAATNEDGFINRIFLYPRLSNNHLSERFSQLYGEPTDSKATVAGKLIGMHDCWITEGDTEISLFNATAGSVISFRFLYDTTAARDYMIYANL